MKTPLFVRNTLCNILFGTYTPLELHQFVQLCYSLALPTIRKKIALGKINLDIIGLQEKDIVHDCLADLFDRREPIVFLQIVRFFERQFPNIDEASDERLLMALRQLVLGKVNNNIIRLYAEADSVLGKILKNITTAVDRIHLFEKLTRFGEAYLITHRIEPLSHLNPIAMERVRDEFSAIVQVRDTIPQMMNKLHRILSEQCEYQRTVPLVAVALMFKEVYALGWELQEEQLEQGEGDDIPGIIEGVSRQLEREMHNTYVRSGKKTTEEFQQYMQALKEMLFAVYVHNETDGVAYFDYLKKHMPELTKTDYTQQHRTIFEYLAKKAKERIREELQKNL